MAPPTFDIAFIGSGIACSMTLLELAQTLLTRRASRRLSCASRWWSGTRSSGAESHTAGAPASARSPFRSSTISSTSPKRSCVYRLARAEQGALAGVLPGSQGGEAAACWLRDNREALDANQVGRDSTCRAFVFGDFHCGAGGCRHRRAQ